MGNCFSDLCGDGNEITAYPRHMTPSPIVHASGNRYQNPVPVPPEPVVKVEVVTDAYVAALERHLEPHGNILFISDDKLRRCHLRALEEAMYLTEGVSESQKSSVETAIHKLAVCLQDTKRRIAEDLHAAEVMLTCKIQSGEELQPFILSIQRKLEETVKRLPNQLTPAALRLVQSKVKTMSAVEIYTKTYRDFFLQPALDIPLEDAKKLAAQTAEGKSRLYHNYIPDETLEVFLTNYKTEIWRNYSVSLQLRSSEEEAFVQSVGAVAMDTYKRCMDAATSKEGRSLPVFKEIHQAVQSSIFNSWSSHLQRNSSYSRLWDAAKPQLIIAMKREFREYKEKNRLKAMKDKNKAMAALKEALLVFERGLDGHVPGIVEDAALEIRIWEAKEKAHQKLQSEAIQHSISNSRIIDFWKTSLEYLMDKRLQTGPIKGLTLKLTPSSTRATGSRHGQVMDRDSRAFARTGGNYSVARSEADRGGTDPRGAPVDLREELRQIVTRVVEQLDTSQVSRPVKKYVQKNIDEANQLLEDETTRDVLLRVIRDKLLGCEERIRFVNSGNSDSYI